MKVVQDPSVAWLSDNWVKELPSNNMLTFGILRIPFDFAVSHRPGARFGPAAIVSALNGFSLHCTDKRVNLESVRFLDLGEVDIVHSLSESYQNIERAVRALPSGIKPIFLGGDHSITDPLFRGLLARSCGKKIGIIVFDAHLDSRPPIAGREHSGHWMHTLSDVIDYSKTAQLGINAPIYSEQYMRSAEENGVLVRTPYEIRRRGWSETVKEAVEHVSRGTDGIYLSIDIDCLDQAFAPGTSVPNPSGLLPHEVADAIFEVSSMANVVGFDITEVSPPLDQQDHTSQLAAHLTLNHIAGTVVGELARCRTRTQ